MAKTLEAQTPQDLEGRGDELEALFAEVNTPDVDIEMIIPDNVKQEIVTDDGSVHEIPDELAEAIRQRYDEFGDKAIKALAEFN